MTEEFILNRLGYNQIMAGLKIQKKMNSYRKDVLVFEFDTEVTELLEQLSLVDDKLADLEESSTAVEIEEKANENLCTKSVKSLDNTHVSPVIINKVNDITNKENEKKDINTSSNSDFCLKDLESKFSTAVTLNDVIYACSSELTSSAKGVLDITKLENKKYDFKECTHNQEVINLKKDINNTDICNETATKLIERGRIKNDKYLGKHRFQEYPHSHSLKWDSPEITNQELLSLFAKEEVGDNIDISLLSNKNIDLVYSADEDSALFSRDVDVDSGYCTSPVSSSIDPLSPTLLDIAEEDLFVETDNDVSSSSVSIISLDLSLNQENKFDDSVSNALDNQLLIKPQVYFEESDHSNNKLSSKDGNVTEHLVKSNLKKKLQSPNFEAITPFIPLKSELRKLDYNLETSAKYKLFYSKGFSREKCRLEYYKIYKDIKKGLLGTDDTKIIHYLEVPKNSYRGTNLHFALRMHNVEKLYCYIEIHKQYHKSLFEINHRDSHLKTILDYAISMKMDYVIDYLKENKAVQSEQCKVKNVTDRISQRSNFKEVGR